MWLEAEHKSRAVDCATTCFIDWALPTGSPPLAMFIRSTALDNEVAYFTTTDFGNLGGVGLVKAEDEALKWLQYTFLLCPNPIARAETVLPGRFIGSIGTSPMYPDV